MRQTSRRRFLKQAAAAAAAALPFSPRPAEPCATPCVRRYTTLGRTGLEVSDIAFGSQAGETPDAFKRTVRHALDRGINYFDTSDEYQIGRPTRTSVEELLGSVLKSVRDEVVIVTKTQVEHPDFGYTEDYYMSALEASLKRLQTDVIDVYMAYSVRHSYDLQHEAWHSFVAKAKEQGKIRYTGVSSHSGAIVQLMTYALDQDIVDVVLLAYTFAEDPRFFERIYPDYVRGNAGLPHILKRAKELNVGVSVMKVQQGGAKNGVEPYMSETDSAFSFYRAAIRWALSNPHVDTVVSTMLSSGVVDQFLGASGYRQLAAGDYERLYRHAMAHNATYCPWQSTSTHSWRRTPRRACRAAVLPARTLVLMICPSQSSVRRPIAC